MSANLDLTDVSNGLGIMLAVDGTRPLPELTASVNAVCDEVERRDGRTVVVLQFDGGHVQGPGWPGEVTIRDVNRWERAVRRLERLPAANVAVASGPCGGPALDLLLAADFRIGTPDLVLVLPVNDGHFWPGMSVYRLVQNLGVARARQIVIWGMDISVTKASELGLVDQVSEDLDHAVQTAVVLMGRVSDKELAVRRQLLLEASAAEYDDALGVHLAACDRELRRLTVAAES
ncbi:enoyl-CoA-hydratase DpgB [Actinoplanes siamensis]|uniref:(3,5-dihydroxycyclohex-3-enyl)acetyl-CoA dehydratase subunit B n=1 Tax=Actinoplanes siamensis TaxID=1223317 RepID=A0A919K8U8_9ACTN|nr:enoyl-CoA-hydratase DpgB [Actinoplanes siamensis]GIF03127.1 hypothetical protein Asi03nite_06650 [Actinoplanes siamensis]